MPRFRPLALAVPALALALGAPAAATSFRMVADHDLVDAADAVATVEVLASAPAAIASFPATDHTVRVERLIAGHLPGSVVTVRVLGGIDPSGQAMEIHGAPRLAAGERALLMLRDGGDGTFRPLHLMLGAFQLVEAGGRELAVRDLAGTVELGAGGARPAVDSPRDLERFSRWIEDRALGVAREADYRVAAKYELMRDDSDGIAIRWFHFDGGGNLEWRVHQGGQGGLGLDRTVAAFQAALGAWSGDPATSVDLRYAGTTDASDGTAGSDGVNAILFGDPRGIVDDTFSCLRGGVIAIGGPRYFLRTREFRGTNFHPAIEADIVTNDGTDCLFRDNPSAAEEVFAHELATPSASATAPRARR
jgi:hypothetical protein